MPIPEISTSTVYSEFNYPDSLTTTNTVDYEYGGIAINDPSEGLAVKVWKLEISGDDIVISENGANSQVLFTAAGTTEVSLAFDQNMNPFVAFMQSGQAKYRWYDSTIPGFTISNLPSGTTNPRACLDDKRSSQILIDKSDIILAYLNSGNLYTRIQRERFLTERVFKSGVTGELIKIGMNRIGRLQFMIRK